MKGSGAVFLQEGVVIMTGKQFSQAYAVDTEKTCRTVYEEYYKYVYIVIFSKLRGTASVEDIEECVSDVFAEVFFTLSKSGDERDIKGFISTVAGRRAINRYHALARRQLREDDDPEKLISIADGMNVEQQTEEEQMLTLLMKRINELGEPDSTIVTQRYYYDRTSAEIAKELGMRPSAVRMRSARALKRLKKALEKDGCTL